MLSEQEAENCGSNTPAASVSTNLSGERGSVDQEKAQKLADLIAETQLAASLPRHRESARELGELRQRLDDLARDVREVLNALADQTASSRRRPNVVIIAPGDNDPASIAADLMGGGD